jgi:hypothetical protein
MARNLPELIFFISMAASWNYFGLGSFNSNALLSFDITLLESLS